MEEISLHVLDIAQNSVAAGARHIAISIREHTAADRLTVSITDDGGGINPEILSTAADPFTTTRTTRKVGLGLALLEAACRAAGGILTVTSGSDGTCVTATFQLAHVDRAPLGDIASTLIALIAANPGIRISYEHEVNGREFTFDSDEAEECLEDLDVRSPLVLQWLHGYLDEHLDGLYQGMGRSLSVSSEPAPLPEDDGDDTFARCHRHSADAVTTRGCCAEEEGE